MGWLGTAAGEGMVSAGKLMCPRAREWVRSAGRGVMSVSCDV